MTKAKFYTTYSSLSVKAAIGVSGLDNPRSNANAVVVACRVLNAGCPDAESAVYAVRASNQVVAGKLEMAVRIDSPAGALSVPGCRLRTGSVANLALAYIGVSSAQIKPWFDIGKSHTHTGAVDVNLLRSGGSVVQEERSLVQVEGRILLAGAGTAGILSRQTSEDAAQGRVEALIVDGTAGVDGNQAKFRIGGYRRGGLSRSKGRGGGSGQSSKRKAVEVHF